MTQSDKRSPLLSSSWKDTRNALRLAGVVSLFLAVALWSGSTLGATIAVSPTDPWCTTINTAAPGDEIVLTMGSYTSPCWITARGTVANRIMIRSESESEVDGQRAIFAYTGSTSNVLEIRDSASFLTLRGLSFAPTQDGVDAIKIRQANDILIERNTFQGIGGISIGANSGNTQRITVRQNTFRDLKATGLYFGCHDGIACHATDLVIENNLIDGVTTPFDPSAVGYGLEVKLNSYATILDNTIYRTKGPGLMVYGSNRGDPPSVVEGNYVEGSLTEGGIVIGGGPAIIQNNVLVGNAFGGISAQNYGGRDLQQNVWIVHNTILNNSDSGINVAAWRDGRGNVIAFNAILPKAGTPTLRPSSPAGTITRNVTCSASPPCFVQSATAPYDLRPAVGGPLVDAAGSGPETWRPRDDFMGVPRGSTADVGAFERTASPNNHLLGGGNLRPPRVSSDTTTPSAPTALQVW